MPRTRADDSVRNKRTYRLTCARCRSRKVKCDGTTPQCRICMAYGQQCHYDKTPPMSQVLLMAQRIGELERNLESGHTNVADGHHSEEAFSIPVATPSPSQTLSGTQDHAAGDQAVSHVTGASPNFQSTSAVQEPVRDGDFVNSAKAFTGQDVSAMNTDQLELCETRTLEACSQLLRLEVGKIRHFFRTYWTWVFPSFMFLSRPQFLMDSAAGGRFSSPLLLSVICLQATRFTDHTMGQELLTHVRFLLGREIHARPTVPLVQALLQLSARELGYGSLSQAWLYSGMAFRMAVELGIMSSSTRCATNATDQAVGEQLAWSCYLWDKAISLYLGRAPSLPEQPDFEPVVPDAAIETELWAPYVGDSREEAAWTTMPCHGVTCFKNFCKLGPIIHDVLTTIYATKPNSNMLGFIQQTRQRLEEWRSASPPQLVVAQGSLTCPPPHILSQNMLFHTTSILLHRPFQTNSRCRSICRDSAAEVEHLLLLLETAFGLTHVTYLMAYCAYTAATVAMLDLHDGVAGSQSRMNTYLRALYGVRTSCPGIQRSIDIIIKGFEHSPKQAASSGVPIQLETAAEAGPMPAFPFDEFQHTTSFDNMQSNTLPFGSLDPYAIDWSLMANEFFNGNGP